jgi:hypothetical protein
VHAGAALGCRDTTIGKFPPLLGEVATVGSELGPLPPPYVYGRGGNLIPPTIFGGSGGMPL